MLLIGNLKSSVMKNSKNTTTTKHTHVRKLLFCLLSSACGGAMLRKRKHTPRRPGVSTSRTSVTITTTITTTVISTLSDHLTSPPIHPHSARWPEKPPSSRRGRILAPQIACLPWSARRVWAPYPVTMTIRVSANLMLCFRFIRGFFLMADLYV